jgi:hypothetical protein
MRSAQQTPTQDNAATSLEQASRQRQILDQLVEEYQRQVRDVLQHRELVKGSVYLLKTRCGKPSCHCARPQGALHSATVLSWSQSGKTRIRSLAAGDHARIRRLTEDYRRLRHARADLMQLHRRILEAVDRLEQALLLPPPAPTQKRK